MGNILKKYIRVFSRLIKWIQQNKMNKKIIALTRDWTQITCLAVSHSNRYARMFSVLVWGCSWIIFMHDWFCPVHLIGRKLTHFENIKSGVLSYNWMYAWLSVTTVTDKLENFISLLLKHDIERHSVFSCSIRFRWNVFNHRMCFRVMVTVVIVDEHSLPLLPVGISHLHSSVYVIRIVRQPGGVDQQFLIVVVAAVDWGVWVGEADDGGSLALVARGVWLYLILLRKVFEVRAQSSRLHSDRDVVILVQILLVAFWVDSVVIV